MSRSETGISPLDLAQIALTSAKRRADERREQKIDNVFETFQSPEVSADKDVASQVCSALKSQIGTFVQSSEGLMRVLDEVGKIHPFIQVAVIPFKAALALELKRLDNDKKVLALFVQMSDMMSNLRSLETIKPDELGKEGIKIADRMSEQLEKAASDIQECSHITDDYYKSKFIVKLLRSNSWEGKFTGFTSTFASLAGDFNTILALYTGVGVQTIHRITERLDGKLDKLMKLVFENLVSPEEQELNKFIDAKGGPEKFFDDDELLRELIRKRDDQVSRSGAGAPVSVGLASVSGKTARTTNFTDIKSDLKTSFDKSLAESQAFFNQKFEEQKNQISEVEAVVRHESDRIILKIMSGPKDRIRDKAMYAMWVEMGWKGSAKSRHVVLAIRDFYTDQFLRVTKDKKDHELAVVQTPVVETDLEEKHTKTRDLLLDLPVLTEDDIWAIGRINSVRLRPLQEALDPDCSDFVTIHELNQFTAARPTDWSLPLWLAYWTSGFEVTLRQYTFRIRSVLYGMSSIYQSLVPGNAGAFSRLMISHAMFDIDLIVAGIHTSPLDDLAEEYPHSKFREYAARVERRIEKRWKSLDYFIDEQNTLSLVIGDGNLEEYALPLIYLILRRILSILEVGKTRVLTDADFRKPLTSLDTIRAAIFERTVFLKGIFKLRNLAFNEEIRRYCYALYYYVAVLHTLEGLDTATSYYNLPNGHYDVPDHPVGDLNSEADEEPSKDTGLEVDAVNNKNNQNVVSQEEEDDIESVLNVSAKLETSVIDQSVTSSAVGVWHGYDYYGFYGSVTDGVMGFRIDTINEDGAFVGGGSDSLSGFTITGKLNGRRISYFEDRLINKMKTRWFYSGKINSSFDVITGKWGDPSLAENERVNGNNNSEDLDDENDDSENTQNFLGRFTVQKKPEEFFRFRPSDDEFKLEENKPRALWKFALNAVMDSVSQRVLTWSNLKKRRDDRRRYIYLWTKYGDRGLQDKESEEYLALQRRLSSVDVRLYRFLAQIFRSRVVQHQASCDSCFKFPISMTRYMCLKCSAEHCYETVDICGDCVDKESTVFRNNGKQKKHDSSHTLLQIRRPLSLRDHYRTKEDAKLTLSRVPSAREEFTEMVCNINLCKESIKERPYWSCCTCKDIFVCKTCNSKVEKDQPWLFEVKNVQHKRTDNSEKHDDKADQLTPNPHHWSHDLVLVTNPEPPKKSWSVEERLTNLEERSERQNKVMEGIQDSVGETRKQLQRLEDMLQQLIKVPQREAQ